MHSIKRTLKKCVRAIEIMIQHFYQYSFERMMYMWSFVQRVCHNDYIYTTKLSLMKNTIHQSLEDK